MPTINAMPIWYPPQFPLQGRLPTEPEQVRDNLYRRSKAERDHHDSLCRAAGRRVTKPCCKSLYITLCFDGTGNNLNNDLFESGDQPHPTNIARMFRASIGTGHVGGTSHRGDADRLTDTFSGGTNEYFKYYIPGVGTPFPEVGDLEYGIFGLAAAGYGEERIHWGLLMIIDALRRALGMPRKDHATLSQAIRFMGTHSLLEHPFGANNRRRRFMAELLQIVNELREAMAPNPGQCQLLGLQLYVYGFSRGAAAARTFVRWLNDLLNHDGPAPCLQVRDVRLPVSVEYLGILDTVASVGIADFNPLTSGHMSWADGTQQLPDNGLIKRCLHIVASHEQRLCFPLDSIRREDGTYPTNSVEVLHPGVHSDQGGGYPPGDQGKACGADPLTGDGLLLSQIALNDLYFDAFSYGAPLKVLADALPREIEGDTWRVMPAEVSQEFIVSPVLIDRFNAWRNVTLAMPSALRKKPQKQIELYQPSISDQTIEQALANQMAWITAWRIDRYAFHTLSLEKQAFYKQASDEHAEEKPRKEAERIRDSRQNVVLHEHKVQLSYESRQLQPVRPLKPGIKDFDPDMAKTQLREAAEEFAADYLRGRPSLFIVPSIGLPFSINSMVELFTQYNRLKSQGRALVSRLFPPPFGERNHWDEQHRGNVDESLNATEPEGLLRALFDEQVHDSRAWFLYWSLLNYLGRPGREPFGSYLRDRAVYFGDSKARTLVAYDQNDQPVSPEKVDLWGSLDTQSSPQTTMSAERLSVAQDNIDALFEKNEVNDVPV